MSYQNTKVDWPTQKKERIWAITCGHVLRPDGYVDHEKSKNAIQLRFPTKEIRDYIFDLIERDLK